RVGSGLARAALHRPGPQGDHARARGDAAAPPRRLPRRTHRRVREGCPGQRRGGPGMSQGFKNRYLSVSRLRRFERCPLAFKLHYVDQLESEPMQALRFGTLLHAVLERLYQWALAEKHTGPIPDELALDIYSDE